MRIALVAGETSGDLLGAGLIRALRDRVADCTFEGVAGPAMQAAGCDAIEQAEALAVMGLIEPLREIPRLLRLRRALIERWTDQPPDVFVGIDAPDFNLGLELSLRARNIPTVHYVSPSVWAWRQGRARKIANAVDRVLCLLPFEKTFYDERGIAADFVGHPMADNISATQDTAARRAQLGIHSTTVVAVLPGSRLSEVSRLGPVFAASCARLAASHDGVSFVAPMATARIRDAFAAHIEEAQVGDHFLLTDGNAEAAIAAADVVLLASGTATLQAALLGKPMVVAYRLAPVTYAIVKSLKLIKVPYFALPNLLTAAPLVEEFLQGEANPEALSGAVAALLNDPARRAHIAAQFATLRGDLARGADQRAAEAVLEVAHAATG